MEFWQIFSIFGPGAGSEFSRRLQAAQRRKHRSIAPDRAMTAVGIHQPNFFPWLGYFDKMANADVFVFLDAVAFARRSWTNRVRLNIQGAEQWATCPLRKLEYGSSILGVEIDDAQPWRRKIKTTLERNYARAEFYERTMALIGPLIDAPHVKLVDFNVAAIQTIANALEISTPTRRQSEMAHEGASNDLLVSLVRAAGGDAYLIGQGAGDYHDPSIFERAGVRVVEQGFKPFSYGPPKRFIPGLSVIDYLMHDGRPLARRNTPE